MNGTSLAPLIDMAMHSDGNGRKEADFQTNKIYKEGNVDEVATSDSDFAKVLNDFIWEKILNHSKKS